MPNAPSTLRSDMAWSDASSITVQGLDLCGDVIGKLDLGAFAFLEILGRAPTAAESTMFNALLATLVEHGMTPMAIATRLTYLGAPESLQSAVAAGICGMGTTFAGTAEGSARLLQEALAQAAPDADLGDIARGIVADHRQRRQPLPGIGHPLHKPVDPRTVRLFGLAAELGFRGRHVALMEAVSAEAERAMGKPGQLPVNATGALGALSSEIGIPWRLCRGLAVIGRAVGLVGHIAEELRHPIARTLWERTEAETSSHHRPSV